MRKYFVGFISVSMFCFVFMFSAFASNNNSIFVQTSSSANFYNRGGWVLGVVGGGGKLSTPVPFSNFDNSVVGEIGSGNTFSDSLSSPVLGFQVGYKRPVISIKHLLLGAQVGFKYLGKSKYTMTQSVQNISPLLKRSTLTSYDADILLTSTYYVKGGWNIFAKGGLAVLDSSYKYDDTINDVNVKQSSWNFRPEVVFGTGYTFRIKPQVGLDVTLSYDHIASEPEGTMPAGGSGNNITLIPIAGSDAVLIGVSLNADQKCASESFF